jgi:hypothetical protein
MTTTAKRLVAGSVLTGSAVTYYTAPTATRAIPRSAQLVNTTASAVSCTVYVVPSGGTAGAANTVISGKSIAAGETYNCPELVNQVLEPGSTLQALGNGVTLAVSGVEIV